LLLGRLLYAVASSCRRLYCLGLHGVWCQYSFLFSKGYVSFDGAHHCFILCYAKPLQCCAVFKYCFKFGNREVVPVKIWLNFHLWFLTYVFGAARLKIIRLSKKSSYKEHLSKYSVFTGYLLNICPITDSAATCTQQRHTSVKNK